MLLGLLSDTHMPGHLKELWPEAQELLKGVDLILHAGDVLGIQVVDALAELAPVLVALGNNDSPLVKEDPRTKPVHILDIEGWRVGLIHDIEPEDRPMKVLIEQHLGCPVDVLVSGHTHFERIQFREGVLLVNPGSPTLPHQNSTRLGTIGLLELNSGSIRAEIVRLGNTPEHPNPGQALSWSWRDGLELSTAL